MGNFRVTIDAVGNHGQDRSKKNGEIVDFDEGSTGDHPTPEAIIKEAVKKLKSIGCTVSEATVHHWPGTGGEVVDNLLTKKRIGDF